jgi:hypothetical protein
MDETKTLIEQLRARARYLRFETTLHTTADLLEKAADLLEKQCTALIATVECKFPVEILDALADVSCDECANRIRAIRDTY